MTSQLDPTTRGAYGGNTGYQASVGVLASYRGIRGFRGRIEGLPKTLAEVAEPPKTGGTPGAWIVLRLPLAKAVRRRRGSH